jgi:hypothetical protein
MPGDLINIRGADLDEVFAAAQSLGTNRADLQAALAGQPTAAGVASQVGGQVLQHPAQQTAPAGFANVAAPLTQVPVQQPVSAALPPNLSKYNTLVPGLPTQPCAVCGQTAYPVTFSSKAGKSFSKYKCGVDDKSHDNPWI